MLLVNQSNLLCYHIVYVNDLSSANVSQCFLRGLKREGKGINSYGTPRNISDRTYSSSFHWGVSQFVQVEGKHHCLFKESISVVWFQYHDLYLLAKCHTCSKTLAEICVLIIQIAADFVGLVIRRPFWRGCSKADWGSYTTGKVDFELPPVITTAQTLPSAQLYSVSWLTPDVRNILMLHSRAAEKCGWELGSGNRTQSWSLCPCGKEPGFLIPCSPLTWGHEILQFRYSGLTIYYLLKLGPIWICEPAVSRSRGHLLGAHCNHIECFQRVLYCEDTPYGHFNDFAVISVAKVFCIKLDRFFEADADEGVLASDYALCGHGGQWRASEGELTAQFSSQTYFVDLCDSTSVSINLLC